MGLPPPGSFFSHYGIGRAEPVALHIPFLAVDAAGDKPGVLPVWATGGLLDVSIRSSRLLYGKILSGFRFASHPQQLPSPFVHHDSLVYEFLRARLLPPARLAMRASLPITTILPAPAISSTPVIDRGSGPHGTIYGVAMSKGSSGYFPRIHALDVTTGQEQFGGPVTIKARYPGTGDNPQNGFVVLDPKQHGVRQGLLLPNHMAYTGWTSHCDWGLYTGWVIGYNQSTLAQTSVLNVTPNGSEGSIWQPFRYSHDREWQGLRRNHHERHRFRPVIKIGQ